MDELFYIKKKKPFKESIRLQMISNISSSFALSVYFAGVKELYSGNVKISSSWAYADKK